MRTEQRLRLLKKWLQDEICAGRKLKTPARSGRVAEMTYTEPPVFVMFAPSRPDITGQISDPENVAPNITILISDSEAMTDLEQRFDRYNKISRPDEMAQTLVVNLLFTVYEPGVRLKGFTESAERREGPDMQLLMEASEQGVYTLFNWMDDCVEKLMSIVYVPGTDMTVDKKSIRYSPYVDQNYDVDRRPLYYGFVTVRFICHVDAEPNKQLMKILD